MEPIFIIIIICGCIIGSYLIYSYTTYIYERFFRI
jgi:hypothetical protein